jgi:hypothetical protein
MEVKVNATIKVLKNEREHVYSCDNGSPLGEAFDVLTEMRNYIIQRIQEQEIKKEPEAVSKVEELKQE